MHKQMISAVLFTAIFGIGALGRANDTGDIRANQLEAEMAQRGFSPEQIQDARETQLAVGVYEDDAVPTIATLRLMGLSTEHYYTHHRNMPLTEYYNRRVYRSAPLFLGLGIGFIAGGSALFCTGWYIIKTSDDPWMLEELFGGLLAGIGAPLTIAGVALTIVGGIKTARKPGSGTLESASVNELNSYKKSKDRERAERRRNRSALTERLFISPELNSRAKTLSIGIYF